MRGGGKPPGTTAATPAALAVPLAQALAFRLARQHLTNPAPDAVTAARTLLGAQAQVQSAGLLQLRARSLCGLPDAAATTALGSDRSLIKLWAHRGTVHLVARDDLPMVLATNRLRTRGYESWYLNDGLTPERIELLVAAIARTLAQHGPHSRMDLSRRLVPELGDWARPWLEHSWGGVIKLACALGHVCHGPGAAALDDGGKGEREAMFVHLPCWTGNTTVMEGATGATALLRRYLLSYGPASPADFRKFTGLPAAPVAAAFQALSPHLIKVDMDGRAGFILDVDEGALRDARPDPDAIVATPLFDPWLLAHADTSQYLDPRFRPAVYRVAGWISPAILRGGRVVATWSHKRTTQGWQVIVSPLERVLKKDLPAIRRALSRLAGDAGLAGVTLEQR